MRIVISSGHGLHVRGASGLIDEVDEARRVVDRVAELIGSDATVFHDDTSTSQDENLRTIVNFHNSRTRDLDVSVHFNAYVPTSNPMGTEVLYVTQEELATDLAGDIADAGGFIDRGGKYRSDLYFLNNTEMPAVLIETCFVDSSVDVDAYRERFEAICEVIAETVSGHPIEDRPDPPDNRPDPPPVTGDNRVDIVGVAHGDVGIMVNGQFVAGNQFRNMVALNIAMSGDVTVSINGQDFHNEEPDQYLPVQMWAGKTSWFGGPNDTGVDPDEGLAFLYDYDDAPDLFLPVQPPGTTGLARRLDPEQPYVAVRWDYDTFPKEMLASDRYMARVRAVKTGREYLARPADWGPHEDTGRVADVSPALLEALGIETDDEVEVTYPIAAFSGL